MSHTPYALKISREDFPDIISGGENSAFRAMPIDSIGQQFLQKKEILVGYWVKPCGDPLPDFIVVRDDEFTDTMAWLAAFLTGLAPISQWCRVWRLSQFLQLPRVSGIAELGSHLGAWVGAILAEFGAQNPSVTLKEASAFGALNGLSFCAAKALAIWGQYDSFDELCRRFDQIRRRDGRGVSTDAYMSLWYVIAGERWQAKAPPEATSLNIFRHLVQEIATAARLNPEDITGAAKFVGRHFNLVELERCATGPQGQRVDALDRLAERLNAGPQSHNIEALLGFGASLIDPGASVLPELLRRYQHQYPFAAVWAGAFAGLWAPVRVLSDHSGLGRLVAKQLTAVPDIFAKPSADISFEELHRWTGGNFSSSISIRGVTPRSLSVELMPGVTVSLPSSRFEASRNEAQPTQSGIKQQAFDLDVPPKNSKVPHADDSRRPDLAIIIERIETLERAVEALSVKPKSSARSSTSRGTKR